MLFKLAEYDPSTMMFRFYSKNRTSYIDRSLEQLAPWGFQPLRKSTEGHTISPLGANGYELTGTKDVKAVTLDNRCIKVGDFCYPCPDEQKAKEALAVLDSMIFSKDFTSRFPVVKCHNYNFSHGGVEASIVTAIPHSREDGDMIKKFYTPDEVKNAVLAYMRKRKIQGVVRIVKNSACPAVFRRKMDGYGCYEVYIKVQSFSEVPAPSEFVVNPRSFDRVNSYAYQSGLWFQIPVKDYSRMLMAGQIKEVRTPLPHADTQHTRSSSNVVGQRLCILDGEVALIGSYCFADDWATQTHALASAHSAYKTILGNDLVNDLHIKGISQGNTPMPYFGPGQEHMFVDVPMNLSDSFFSMEEIVEAIRSQMEDYSDTYKVAAITSVKNHILFKIQKTQKE